MDRWDGWMKREERESSVRVRVSEHAFVRMAASLAWQSSGAVCLYSPGHSLSVTPPSSTLRLHQTHTRTSCQPSHTTPTFPLAVRPPRPAPATRAPTRSRRKSTTLSASCVRTCSASQSAERVSMTCRARRVSGNVLSMPVQRRCQAGLGNGGDRGPGRSCMNTTDLQQWTEDRRLRNGFGSTAQGKEGKGSL